MDNFFELSKLEEFYAENPNSTIFAILASRYLEQGNIDKALSVIDEGLKKHPNVAFGHYISALCHYQQDNVHKAKEHLDLALAYDDKRVNNVFGQVFLKTAARSRGLVCKKT